MISKQVHNSIFWGLKGQCILEGTQFSSNRSVLGLHYHVPIRIFLGDYVHVYAEN